MARRRSLTLQERQELERRWARGDNAVQIARDMDVSNATIYKELRRGKSGELDENARPAYRAELGQMAFQTALRNRGRRATAQAAD